jgi:hypothetical protein
VAGGWWLEEETCAYLRKDASQFKTTFNVDAAGAIMG